MNDLLPEQIQNLLKVLYETAEDKKCLYFSGVMRYFNAKEKGLADTIDDYSTQLGDEILVERTLLYESMGISNYSERPKITSLISKAKLQNYASAQQLANSANRYFTAKKYEYRIPDDLIGKLQNIVIKCQEIESALRTIEIVIRRDSVLLIKGYAGKYLKLDNQVITNVANQIRRAYQEMGENALDTETMVEIAQETLKSLNYIDLAIKQKNPLELADMMWKEMLAAESILLYRKLPSIFDFSEEELLENAICDTLIAHNLF